MAHTTLQLLSQVENNALAVVQHQLKSGAASANAHHLGVYPLNLAIEYGYVNMVAVLLMAGAETTNKQNGAKHKDAMELATAMSKDKKCKLQKEAKIILEMMTDKEVAKRRFHDAQEAITAQNAKDVRIMKLIMAAIVPMMAGVAYAWRAGYLNDLGAEKSPLLKQLFFREEME